MSNARVRAGAGSWRWPRLLLAGAGVTLASVTALRAQSVERTERADRSVAFLADSIAANGDTVRAYALLDSALRTRKDDGSAWHQFGLLNWNMARSKRKGNFVSDQRTVRLLQGADTALRMATKVAPDSARFWLSLGRFNLQSGVSTMRFAAASEVSHALDAATRAGDIYLLATAADEVGMAAWRRYEPIANRAQMADGQQKIQLGYVDAWGRSKARDFIDTYIHKIIPPTGDKDYQEALEHFRTAVHNDPSSQRFSRHLYMAFGERERWNEMLDLATRRSKTYPLDYQAQLARGLALHRLGNEVSSQVAFDSAFVLMDDDERTRLTRFTRILRPQATRETRGTLGDSIAFRKLPPEQQRGLEQMYWYMNDPLTLTTENEFRLEFLSRVVWSDFRWTNEDLNLLGADTDRGDVFVRYGPPEMEMTVPGSSSNAATAADGGVTLVWVYRSGLVFFFDLPPGFGTARFAFIDRDNVDKIKSAMPVSFANLAATRMIDTIPIRVARFRAGADSSDVVIAAPIPVDSLVRGLDVTMAPVDLDFRIFDQFVRVHGIESERQTVRPDSVNAPFARTWRRRLGPGINVVRVEALQADSRRAARAMTRINPESNTGFGMSDVLLGSKPSTRDGAAPKRWSDVSMEPTMGSFARGSSVGLLWEMYELAARDGTAKYRLAITVERTDRGGAGNVVARIVDGLGRTVGRQQQSRDKLSITFDRSAAAAGVLVEYLSLDLSASSPGTYRLRVEVTDSSNGRKTSRETLFVVH